MACSMLCRMKAEGWRPAVGYPFKATVEAHIRRARAAVSRRSAVTAGKASITTFITPSLTASAKGEAFPPSRWFSKTWLRMSEAPSRVVSKGTSSVNSGFSQLATGLKLGDVTGDLPFTGGWEMTE